MRRRVFFDTWGWVAIANRCDNRHADAFAFYKDFLLGDGLPVTSDYVLSETISLLRSRTAALGSTAFMEGVLDVANSGRIVVEHVTKDRWLSAWKLSKKFADKPEISFPDFTSFLVMKELQITEALTADHHFEEVGMGFKKLF